MEFVTTGADRTTGSLEHHATRIVFFIAGFSLAAWAPLVPFAKARAGLGEGMLGLLLLGLGAGSIATMPLAGAISSRLGCRLVMTVSAILLCLSLPLLATVSTAPHLAAALVAFGASIGALEVTMNIQAVIVERASRRPMMSGFHGLFSVGGIAGSVGVTALLGAGASPLTATLCVVAAIIIAFALAWAHLLPYGSRAQGPVFALPHGIVLFIGMLCFICFLTEGAVLDWSAVFLTSARGMQPTYAGLGYAAFAASMTVGRLTGDRIVWRLGGSNVVMIGAVLAATGFLVTTMLPSWHIALLGYALVGCGCSNIVPVLYTGVGRQTAMPEHIAVPAITTFGYLGILAGPAAIGFVARASSLGTAFLILAVLLLGVAAGGRLLRT